MMKVREGAVTPVYAKKRYKEVTGRVPYLQVVRVKVPFLFPSFKPGLALGVAPSFEAQGPKMRIQGTWLGNLATRA